MGTPAAQQRPPQHCSRQGGAVAPIPYNTPEEDLLPVRLGPVARSGAAAAAQKPAAVSQQGKPLRNGSGDA